MYYKAGMAIVILLAFGIKGLGTPSESESDEQEFTMPVIDDVNSLETSSTLDEEKHIPYNLRPFILDIEPKKIQTAQLLRRVSLLIADITNSPLPESAQELSHASLLVDRWPDVRKVYMFFLAELLAFYPDADFYFLARDAEYFYDIAMVLKQEIPEIQNNFHLLPISSKMTHYITKHAREYLQQEGLYSANKRKKTAVIVDTCCKGTVIKYIRSLFPKEHRSKVKGHLFTRNNTSDDIEGDAYPESKISKNILGDKGVAFIEDYPHYFTYSAQKYHQFKGNEKIDILMSKDVFNQSVAIAFMADIRYHFAQKQVQEDFKDILKQMRIVFNYLTSSREKINRKEARVALKTLKKSYSIKPDDFLKDIQEVLIKNKDSFKSNHYFIYEKMKSSLYDKCIKALTAHLEDTPPEFDS